MAYREITKVHEIEDASGNVVREETSRVEQMVKREEADYIKLYSRMWCQFYGIPEKWCRLFVALVCRMSYACCSKEAIKNPNEWGGQLVYVMKPHTDGIMRECGWKSLDPMYKGLKALTECNAIRKVCRGVYQVNPAFAGRGQWRYNDNDKQGGIKNLIAKFNFADGSVETQIDWTMTDDLQASISDAEMAQEAYFEGIAEESTGTEEES